MAGRDRDDHRVVLHSASGPSGARLLGRFCHADDELHQLVRAHLAAEEAVCPERVFAEVVHLPEGRIGNILSRPVLRGYEIPYLGRSGAPADRQLPVSDLLVSVQDERIVLRSRRLGREVIPWLTTAHNHITRGLGVYRFLCALQYQQVRIKPSMTVRTSPPQAYRHARRVQAPTFVSPTLEQMGTFPSTACKPRKTLRYLATAPSSVTRR